MHQRVAHLAWMTGQSAPLQSLVDLRLRVTIENLTLGLFFDLRLTQILLLAQNRCNWLILVNDQSILIDIRHLLHLFYKILWQLQVLKLIDWKERLLISYLFLTCEPVGSSGHGLR